MQALPLLSLTPRDLVVLTACPLFLPAISVASTLNFGDQEPWNRSSHASSLVVRLTVDANTETHKHRNHRGHGHHRPGGSSVSGSADEPHRKIFTGVGPLPTGSSSGQSGHPIATSLESAMRYLCLVYGTEDSLPVMQNPNPISRAEADALTQDSLAYDDVLRTSGHFIVAHALQSVRTATTVRVRGGQVLVTDGPFAETKEQLLGFVLIEAKDHDDAVEVASKIPLARLGSIEVRSIMDVVRIGQSQLGLAVGSPLRSHWSHLGTMSSWHEAAEPGFPLYGRDQG